MDKNAIEFEVGDSKKYKVKAIQNSAIYVKESKSGYLIRFYYLVSWKKYLEEVNIWEPALAVQHLKKLINLFHKNHSDKLTATSPTIDTTPPIARLSVKPIAEPIEQKRDWLANSTNK